MSMKFLQGLRQTLTRKKPMAVGETKLNKFLTTFDLTAMGVGSTLGVGVYVLAGEVAKDKAGPAVIISFAIAAFASLLAGLCYAEFGARVPKAGSVYVYAYVTIGEFVAFLIGWDMILEYAIGSASVAKGITGYIDGLVDKKISKFWISILPIKNVDFLGEYIDLFAFVIIIVLSIGIAFGAKESAWVNNIFTTTNIAIVIFAVTCGCFKLNFSYWAIPSENVPKDAGTGGFFPFGMAGVMKGAATCFFAFIGFDVIATAGEETINPKKSIPLSICLSLLIIFLAYFSISAVLTLIVPYYNQSVDSPLPYAFKSFGWTAAEYIVSFGATFGMVASLFGAIYPLPRIIMAIASDGLLFEVFSRIHPRFRTPFYGTLIAGFLTGTLAAVFNLSQLIDMMSIGTLMAYSIVAACVLLLKHEIDDPESDNIDDTRTGFFSKILNLDGHRTPTKFTSKLATILVTLYALFCIWISLVISKMFARVVAGDALAITLLVIPSTVIIMILVILSRQPKSSKVLSFSVPFTPWFPALSILINIYMMSELEITTWIRFFVWLVVGMTIYLLYGRKKSVLGRKIEPLIE